jgi:hypothetical protein
VRECALLQSGRPDLNRGPHRVILTGGRVIAPGDGFVDRIICGRDTLVKAERRDRVTGQCAEARRRARRR